MKKTFLILVSALIFASCIDPIEKSSKTELNIKAIYSENEFRTDSFTVLELFTTESCYDCPPAQEDFNRFIKEVTPKENIICLSEHVDYWNSLVWGEGECRGVWVDKYSNGFYSARQFAYAREIGETPGSPQVFANGKGFKSDPRYDDYSNLSKEFNRKQAFEINLSLNEEPFENEHSLRVDYETKIDTSFLASKNFRTILIVFLVQDRVETTPDLAENCGKHLISDYVARSMSAAVIKKKDKGTMSLNIPEDLDISECRVMAIVQEVYNLDVVAASQGFKIEKEN